MQDLNQFASQNYIALETFRKNNEGVKTPVWFAPEAGCFYIWTGAESGKVKRIKNNSRVMLAPSKVDGTPIGEWIEGRATANTSEIEIKRVTKLFIKKYGLQFRLYSAVGSLRNKSQTAIVKIEFK